MIIGIGGEKQHGKDTVANYLVEKYEYKKMAFADKLKTICAVAFPDVNFYDEANKETEFESPIAATYTQIIDIFLEVEKDNAYSITVEQGHKITNKYLDKVLFRSVRDILQFVGTNILRDEIDADFHYNTVAVPFKSLTKGVVSDCRFKNERDNLVEDFRATLIKVERPSKEKTLTSKHASETSLGEDSEYKHIIINDGTLEELYEKVDVIMRESFINKE